MRLRDYVGIDEDELRGAVRRSLFLAAAAGDPNDAWAPPTRGPRRARRGARERRSPPRAGRRDPGDLARATGSHLPRAAAVLRELAAPHEDPQLPGACSARRCWRRRPSTSERASLRAIRRRLLALALACQASISIVQWGLGVIAPDLQQRYGLSAASLGALINATALGNAVALIAAGVIVDRSGPRMPLLYAGSACGLLLDRPERC